MMTRIVNAAHKRIMNVVIRLAPSISTEAVGLHMSGPKQKHTVVFGGMPEALMLISFLCIVGMSC